MSRRSYIPALAVSILFAVIPTQALELNKYDQMSLNDKSRYIVTLLKGSEDLLRKQGKTEMANKIVDNFEVIPVGKKVSLGMLQLGRDLEDGRSYQIRNGKTLQVENVLRVTFKEFGIEIPQADMMSFAKDFKPTPGSK